jgi:hypothetical protein
MFYLKKIKYNKKIYGIGIITFFLSWVITYSEEEAKYDHFKYFPILGDYVRNDLGHDIPYPFGISYIGNFNESNIYAKEVYLKDIPMESASGVADLNTQINGVMIDFFLFPFLNLYGFIADVKINGDIEAKVGNQVLKGKYNDNGVGHGYGANFIFGQDNWFLSLNASYIINDMDQIEKDKTIFMFNPRVIYRWERCNVEVWFGGVFLKINEDINGVIGIQEIPYSMILDAEEAMPIVGIRKELFNKSIEIMGDAMYTPDFYGINIRLGYRF